MVAAFPTAEGFGANSLGPRGAGTTPTVYRVTSLADTSTPGTFRYAVTQSGPRFVVFDVAGYIELTSDLIITNPYIYIAGQTAPRGGVCIRAAASWSGAGLRVACHHFIIRHMRFRHGFKGDQYPNPTLGSAGHNKIGLTLGQANDEARYGIVDHCSLTWATVTCGVDGFLAKDLTWQYNILSEPLHRAGDSSGPNHAKCLNHTYDEDSSGGGTSAVPNKGCHTRVTSHHNLMGHSAQRNPQFAQGHGSAESICNLINHIAGSPGGAMNMNTFPNNDITSPKARVVNNYFKKFDSYDAANIREVGASTAPDLTERGPDTKLYVLGNIGPSRPTGTEGHELSANPNLRGPLLGGTSPSIEWTTITDPLCTTSGGTVNTGTFDYPEFPVTEETAQEVYDRLSDTTPVVVGATMPMVDEADARIVARVQAGTVPGQTSNLLDHPGLYAVGGPDYTTYGAGYPDLTVGGSAALWSEPANPFVIASNGYLNIENDLNALAGDTIPAGGEPGTYGDPDLLYGDPDALYGGVVGGEDPVDVTYLTGRYANVSTTGQYVPAVARTGNLKNAIQIIGRYDPGISRGAPHTPSIPKQGSFVNTYSKAGSP